MAVLQGRSSINTHEPPLPPNGRLQQPDSHLRLRRHLHRCVLPSGWLQVTKDASPIHSGVMNIPMFLSQIVGNLLSGGMVTKLGHLNIFIYIDCTLMAIGTGLHSTIHPPTSHAG